MSRDTLHGLKTIMCFDKKQVSNTDMFQFFIKLGVEISVKYMFKFQFYFVW